MFIFDEAHLIADAARGFELEWVLAMLHWKTRETSHRIVLLSAALGNRAEIKRWVDPDGEGKLYSSEWRGPRRLHALFYTDAQWEQPEYVPFSSANWPQRVLYPLVGRVQLRPAEGLSPREVGLTEPVGTLAFRVNEAGVPERQRHASSTQQYLMNAQIARGRRSRSRAYCRVHKTDGPSDGARIASHLNASRETRELTDFVSARRRADHPSVPLLPFRVAYHHAGLPTDVLEALEQALREERLLYLTATTTLTEGVNLPVKSVVLAETRYPGQDPAAQILGARLINAMGRAGRATKETEGWAIICKPGAPQREDFDRLRPADEDLTVTSRLATTEALEALAHSRRQPQGPPTQYLSITPPPSTTSLPLSGLFLQASTSSIRLQWQPTSTKPSARRLRSRSSRRALSSGGETLLISSVTRSLAQIPVRGSAGQGQERLWGALAGWTRSLRR